MKEPEAPPIPETQEAGRGSLLTYTTGFVCSLILTVVAYMLVTRQLLSNNVLIGAILVLAITQFTVQLVFFLHLGKESKPRWNLTAFSFMLIVLGILVLGSLWIMNNLNYHAMTPSETDEFIIEDEGVAD